MGSTEKPFNTFEGSFKQSKASNIWHTNEDNQSIFGLGLQILGSELSSLFMSIYLNVKSLPMDLDVLFKHWDKGSIIRDKIEYQSITA